MKTLAFVLALAAHLLVPLVLLAFPVLVGFVVTLVVVVVAQHVRPLGRAWRSRAADVVGRVALGTLALVALAWCGANVAEILGG